MIKTIKPFHMFFVFSRVDSLRFFTSFITLIKIALHRLTVFLLIKSATSELCRENKAEEIEVLFCLFQVKEIMILEDE